jgi:hypothetical protein
MTFDKLELIEQLKLEARVIESGGYHPSVPEPRKELRIFRDSVSCPNLGVEEKVVPCAQCWLMGFVPPQFQDTTDLCRYVPLNDRGDSIDSLEASGQRDKVEGALLGWIRNTITKLGADVAAGR